MDKDSPEDTNVNLKRTIDYWTDTAEPYTAPTVSFSVRADSCNYRFYRVLCPSFGQDRLKK
jgi:hypothetical protein